MITTDEVIGAVRREAGLLKHLATKVPAGQLDYRPTAGQRSTAELLRYLAVLSAAWARVIASGDTKQFMASLEQSSAMPVEEFAAAVDRSAEEAALALGAIPEAQLGEQVDFFGSPVTRAALLLELVKNMAAYRMQLFLYAKQSGASDIGTVNLWMGQDPKPRQ